MARCDRQDNSSSRNERSCCRRFNWNRSYRATIFWARLPRCANRIYTSLIQRNRGRCCGLRWLVLESRGLVYDCCSGLKRSVCENCRELASSIWRFGTRRLTKEAQGNAFGVHLRNVSAICDYRISQEERTLKGSRSEWL